MGNADKAGYVLLLLVTFGQITSSHSLKLVSIISMLISSLSSDGLVATEARVAGGRWFRF